MYSKLWRQRPEPNRVTLRSNNPHSDQRFPADGGPTALEVLHNPLLAVHQTSEHELVPVSQFKRILALDAPATPYRRRKGERKTTLHWGQRKLLLSEIEFFSIFAPLGAHVIYAGSAPGTHIELLSKWFPTLKFTLVDPGKFTVKETERITTRQEFFTEDTAREFQPSDPEARNDHMLFISDIRSVDSLGSAPQEVEKGVWHDMEQQSNWHKILRPRASMLKFRLPWDASESPTPPLSPSPCLGSRGVFSFPFFTVAATSRYLDGKVYLPIWGPQTTTESRLVVTGFEDRDWDNKLYESRFPSVLQSLLLFPAFPSHPGLIPVV